MHRLWMNIALAAASFPMTSAAQSLSEVEEMVAGSYARENNVSTQEALRRLKIQDALSDEEKTGLRREFESRLAGIYLAHQPDQHMVVRLVGPVTVPPRVIRTEQGDLRVVFHEGQTHTLAELERIVLEFNEELRSIPGIQGFSVDQKTGEVALMIFAPEPERDAYRSRQGELEHAIGAPVRFDIMQGPWMNL